MLELEAPAAAKLVETIAKRNLDEVRHINSWVLSLLRKEAEIEEAHQPGDIEDLSRKVKDACHEEIEAARIRPEDLSARCICALNDLPVGDAVQAVRAFAGLDFEKIQNRAGYLMGMLKRYLEPIERAGGRPPRGGTGGRWRGGWDRERMRLDRDRDADRGDRDRERPRGERDRARR